MNRWTIPVTATAFFAMVLAAPMTTASAQQMGGDLSVQDRYFLLHAAQDGAAEVAMGKVAVEKAQSEEVKQFAQRMIDDHTQANQKLMEMAEQKDIEVPQEAGAVHEQMMQYLQELSGEQFDQAYMQEQVLDHEAAVSLFEKEAQQGQDAELKSFASETLPTLQEHLESAQQLAGAGLTAEQ
ncbi:DUF4142 domain-containing protein [Rhodospirillaceae bacterium SYSU D60014]|uniref:DUF4142 domain-containing protein n=1 Tax=Virgifigura deserti TaxID=2268457 RepID=UPI000E66B6CC